MPPTKEAVQHSPGPWKWNGGYRVCHSVGTPNMGVICDTATNEKQRTPEAAANARLIAKSPDQSKALLWVVLLIESSYSEDELRTSHTFLGSMRDYVNTALTLSKAGGEG